MVLKGDAMATRKPVTTQPRRIALAVAAALMPLAGGTAFGQTAANTVPTNGAYVAGDALQPTQTAKSVRLRDGERLTTDGPFAETKEQIGGFVLIEARDLNEAIQLISRHPGLRVGPWEIRPVEDIGEAIRASEARRGKA